MIRRSWPISLPLLAGAALAAPVFAQIDTIALTGDAAPGGPPGQRLGQISRYGVTINNRGTVYFKSLLDGATPQTGAGLFMSRGGTLETVARLGDPVPGVVGGTYAGTTSFHRLAPFGLDQQDNAAFIAEVSVAGDARDAVMHRTAAATEMLAREGDQAPGRPAGVRFRGFSSVEVGQSVSVGDNGRLAFYSEVTGPGIGAGNYNGIWARLDAYSESLYQAGTAGAPVPAAGPGAVFRRLGNYTAPVEDGSFLIAASFNDPAATSSTAGLFRLRSPDDASLIVRTGSPVPGVPGATVQAAFPSMLDLAANRHGDVAFLSTIRLASGEDSVAVLRYDADGGAALLARWGEAPAGIAGPAVFSELDFQHFSEQRAVVYTGRLAGDPIGEANNSGLWLADPAATILLAREGDAAPGLPAGVVYGDVFFGLSTMSGAVAFTAQLAGPGVTAASDHALFVGAPGGCTPLLREGDLLEVHPGDFRTVAEVHLHVLNAEGDDGRGRSVNDGNRLVFFAAFTDGTTGLFTATVPGPSTAAALAAFAALPRRRRLNPR